MIAPYPRGVPSKYGFDKFKLGQIRLIEFEDEDHLGSIRVAACQYGKRHGIKFSTSRRGTGANFVKVRRIA